jgi:hypothetical protein
MRLPFQVAKTNYLAKVVALTGLSGKNPLQWPVYFGGVGCISIRVGVILTVFVT